jgi:hypothetical protein
MKKQTRPIKPRTHELKKETVLRLTDDQMKGVVGGIDSKRPSQCYTLCF